MRYKGQDMIYLGKRCIFVVRLGKIITPIAEV